MVRSNVKEKYFKPLKFNIMKKLIFLIFCSCLFIGCQNPPEAKNYACKEFSVSCEIEKDFLLVQPVVFDEKTIDVFGNPIAGRSDCQWYIISRKTKLMIPTYFRVCIGHNYVRDVGYEPYFSDCPTAQQINDCKDEWRNMVRADSTDLSLIIPGLTKVIVVVSGPNEILAERIWPMPILAFAKKQ